MVSVRRREAWFLGAKPKPKGGFRYISVLQLSMAWWAQKRGLIKPRDLRAWFACQELVARRCAMRAGRSPRFHYQEIVRLCGVGEHSARSSVRRLERAGLLSWSEERLALAASPDGMPVDDLSSFWKMLEQIPNRRRKVPMPREVLKFLAGGARPSVIATTLGHLLRCLYYRDQLCSPTGATKTSWIASTFEVHVRNVKSARAHLVALGLLLEAGVESPQWALNRDGRWYTVNLEWSRPDADPRVVENSSVGEGRTGHASPPPPRDSRHASPPPESDRELSSRTKNQKPAPGGRHGFSKSKGGGSQKPNLRHIVPEDLADTGRLLVLYQQATKAGFLSDCGPEELKFVALAEHARVIGTRNPCGLFASLLRKKLWHFATDSDEDAAQRRLKQHRFGDIWKRDPAAGGGLTRSPLSADAKVVQRVLIASRNRGFRSLPFIFEQVRKHSPEWTAPRWESALEELDLLNESGGFVPSGEGWRVGQP